MEYLPLYLLMWWTFGVVLIFGKHEGWVKFYDRVPGLATLPQHYVLLLVLLVCIVVFPIPMLVPFEAAWRRFKLWWAKRKLKNALLKTFKTLRKERGAELQGEIDKIIDSVKRL